MSRILDDLAEIETTVPGLQGRLDHSKVAVVGHSLGAWTALTLLGVGNTDPRDGSTFHEPEKRIRAGVVLSGTGSGGKDISEIGQKIIGFYGADFSKMSTPALVVYGDEDVSPHLTNRGAEWHGDSYELSPGSKDLLVLKGGKHTLGGVSGWDAAETTDESPERLAVLQRMTLAYLKSQLYDGDKSWAEACKALQGLEELGIVKSK